MASSRVGTGVTKALAMLLLGVLGLTGTAIPQVMEEYCNEESFEASCGADEVVMMLAAQYGRMQLGRCVKKDLGYVGCADDALEVLDHLCSGRHECKFRIPDLDKYRVNSETCLSELKSYLEASYTCVKVHSANKHECQRSDHVRVSSSEGYLASIVTEETGCGTGGTPWVIAMKPGQQVNLTLLDFGVIDARQIEVAPGGTQVCHAYAIIREKDSKETRTLCGGRQRRQMLFTSSSSRLEVRIFNRRGTSTAHRFLLKYQAVGCPDLELSRAYEVVRQGNVMQAKCKSSGESWRLHCSGSEWNGRVGNCSSGHAAPFGEVVLGSISLSFEISVIIISVIASIISLCILIIGIICLRRKRAAAQQNQNVYSHRQPRKSDPYAQATVPSTNPHENPQVGRHDGNEYACILEMPLPPPPPGANVEIGFEARTTDDATYETHRNIPPTLQRIHKESRSRGTDGYPYHPYDTSTLEVASYEEDPRYFELDPDNISGVDANCNAGPAIMDMMHPRSLDEREKQHPSKFSK